MGYGMVVPQDLEAEDPRGGPLSPHPFPFSHSISFCFPLGCLRCPIAIQPYHACWGGNHEKMQTVLLEAEGGGWWTQFCHS